MTRLENGFSVRGSEGSYIVSSETGEKSQEKVFDIPCYMNGKIVNCGVIAISKSYIKLKITCRL